MWKSLPRKAPRFRLQVSGILTRNIRGGRKLLQVALKSVPSQLNKRLLILIDHEAHFVAIDAKLMKRGPHLRRKREIGCGASSSQMVTLSSSMISVSPRLLRNGLINPYAMTFGDWLVRNSAILATRG